ncbi:MAG: DUF4430 domain-containing protein [Candidatus Thorarchaeota archaeon]
MLNTRVLLVFVVFTLSISVTIGPTQVGAQDDPIINGNYVILEIDYGNGDVEEYHGYNGSTVLEVLQNTREEVIVEWYGNLAYVTSIKGVANDNEAGLFWQFWVNDELAPVAANLMTVEPGDRITWRRTSSNFITPTQEELDVTLFGGVLVISIIGSAFLGLLQITTMRRIGKQ